MPERKITGYLLSLDHPDGKARAQFFRAFGFSGNDWQRLARALIQHASDHEVRRVEETPFGTRYIIEGMMGTPDGRTPAVRSVWFVEEGQEVPRLVTAYPLEGKQA